MAILAVMAILAIGDSVLVAAMLRPCISVSVVDFLCLPSVVRSPALSEAEVAEICFLSPSRLFLVGRFGFCFSSSDFWLPLSGLCCLRSSAFQRFWLLVCVLVAAPSRCVSKVLVCSCFCFWLFANCHLLIALFLSRLNQSSTLSAFVCVNLRRKSGCGFSHRQVHLFHQLRVTWL